MKTKGLIILGVLVVLFFDVVVWEYFQQQAFRKRCRYETNLLKALQEKQRKLDEKINRLQTAYYPLPYESAKEVVFTLDDGPFRNYNPGNTIECTEIILDALKEANIKATFFVLGCQFDYRQSGRGGTLKRYKKWLRRMAAEGHTVTIHDNDHISYFKQSRTELTNSLRYTYQKIKEITGIAPAPYVRSPGGMISQSVQQYLTKHNYQHIYWHINGEPLEIPPGGYLKHIQNQLNQGRRGIILMHDRNAYLYIKELISFLKSKDIPVITLEEWIRKYGLPRTPLRPHQGKFGCLPWAQRRAG